MSDRAYYGLLGLLVGTVAPSDVLIVLIVIGGLAVLWAAFATRHP